MQTIDQSSDLNNRLKTIVIYTLKQKLYFEYIKFDYEKKNFYLLILNMFFNTINAFIFGFSDSFYFKIYIEEIYYTCIILDFICSIFTFMIKILDYSKHIGLYQSRIDSCNDLICYYINYKTNIKTDDDKMYYKNKIITSYEVIIKLSSLINHNKLILMRIWYVMHDEYDNILEINYGNVKNNLQYFKRKSIAI